MGRHTQGLFTWRRGAPANRATRVGGLKHSTPLHATHLSGIVSRLSFAWPLSTTNKMADKRDILVVSLIFFSLVPLADAFQCLGLLFCTLLIERNHQRQLTLKAALEYTSALAKLRHIRRRVVRRHGILWRSPGRTDQWWQNLFNSVLPEVEWKKSFRMDRQIFTELADELRP